MLWTRDSPYVVRIESDNDPDGRPLVEDPALRPHRLVRLVVLLELAAHHLAHGGARLAAGVLLPSRNRLLVELLEVVVGEAAGLRRRVDHRHADQREQQDRQLAHERVELLLERGNLDAVVLWSAVAAVILVRRWNSLWAWSIAAALIWVMGTWKYYPFAMGLMLLPLDGKGGYAPLTQFGRPMICAERRTAWQMVRDGEVGEEKR